MTAFICLADVHRILYLLLRGDHMIHIRDKELDIVQEAREGATGRALAIKYNVSPSTISNIFRRHEFKPPTGRRPTCEIDHGAFEDVTPESAYWMGMLCTDGCIVDYQDGAPQIILDLAEKDRAHVEKFRSFLKSTHAITTLTRAKTVIAGYDVAERRSVAFRVRSAPLVEALARRGIACKSPLRTPTKDITDSVDFWRGCIDGDGTVRWTTDRAGYTYASLILCGHMPLLEKFQIFLARVNVTANVTDTTSGIYQIRLLGSGALKVIELLYKNDNVALDRKAAIAYEIIQKHGVF
jgi:hypothetical protein